MPAYEGLRYEPAELTAADLARDLGGELELPAAVVDRPGPVGLQVQALAGVGEQVLERPGRAGLEVDVRHAHDRLAREALGAGAPR